MRVIAESHTLKGDDIGELLHPEGLHLSDVEPWRNAAEVALGLTKESVVEAKLRERAEVAEKPLARNKKALAET